MLSRPGQVGLEAGPELEQAGQACPRTTTWPGVGWRTPQMHLSSVDLPDPLRPRMPTVSPSFTSKETSRSAQRSSYGIRPPWITRSFSEVYFSW